MKSRKDDLSKYKFENMVGIDESGDVAAVIHLYVYLSTHSLLMTRHSTIRRIIAGEMQ